MRMGAGKLGVTDARAGPGITPRYRRKLRGSTAALGFPNPRAGTAAPGTRAACAAETAFADRAFVAGTDVDDHGAVLADLAGDVDGRGAGIAETAVGDAHGIAIGGIALAALGYDDDAPKPVVARAGVS